MLSPLQSRTLGQYTGRLGVFLLLLFTSFFITIASTPPPDRIIRGTVRDAENNTPLPGVNVLIKGTQRGTVTNGDGQYELTVPEQNAQLVVSFVGYLSKTVDVGRNATLDIALQVDQKTLDEMVVVGYGTQSRRNVTGSVTKIDMKQTENLPNTNITQSLRGRVAGVQFTDNGRPGQNGSILVRGPRSLSGGNNPLIVLDGIIFNAGLQNINPNDIESMEVLKDASAAAIYGSRAANGVILITSKKGTTEKPTIRFNGFSGLAERALKVKLLTPERYIERMRDYNRQAGLAADKLSDFLYASEIANMNAGRVNDHWDMVSQQGKISSYDLSLSGRSSRTNYYVSAAWVNEQGIYLNDQMKRLTLRTNIENEVAKWLTVGVTSTFITRDQSGSLPAQSSNIHPFSTLYYDDGEPRQYMLPEDQVSQGNPLYSALMNSNETIVNNLFTNFYAIVDAPFLQGLTYRVNFSPNYRWDHNYNFFRQDKHIALNTTNASKFNRQDYDWVLENILTYKGQINNDNQFDITLLYGRNHTGQETTTANASQFASEILGWNNFALGGLYTTTSTANQTDGVSSMLRLNYRLKQKYLATFTMRRDGSSVFAANNKYALFPSAALSWIVSNEPFFKKSSVIDMLKFRVSYGAVGNQAINPYQSLSASGVTRYVFGDGGSPSLGIFPNRMANTNLKWETTYTANAALDFELLKGRINGTAELYAMNTNDLLVQRSLPTMTGYTSVWTNLGGTSNRGFELTVNTVNLKKGKFEWSTNLTFSTNKNKIVKLYGSDTNGDGREDDDIGNKWFIGQPMSVAYDYLFDGVYQVGDNLPSGYKAGDARMKDLNGDGKITPSDDRAIIGQTGQPAFRWGIANTFQYGNFSFSFFVNAMQGWIESIDLAGNSLQNDRNFNRIDYGWWTPENKSNVMPSLIYSNPLGHSYYVSRDFVRLQDVSLAYSLPKQIAARIKLADCRMIVSGKNLLTFTKWPGADPESGSDQSGIPLSRMVTVGLNFGF
ncbi:TonB-dependent receptor [Spirosoma daeguense]